MHQAKKNLIAIASICALAYLFAAAVGACSKLIDREISIATILFFQNWICLLLTLPQIFRKGWKTLKTDRLGLHLARDIAGILAFFCFFFSLKTIPLLSGILLQNAGPLWLPWIALLWLGIKMRGQLWWGILIGFLGVVLILKPGIEPLSLGMISAIAAGIFSGFTLIAVNRLRTTEPIYRILFYYFLVGTIATGIFSLFHFSIPSWRDFACLLGVGVFTFLAQQIITYVLRHGNADVLAPISYTVVIYSGLLDWAIWHNIPDWITATGIVLIVAGAILSVYFEKRYQKKISSEM